MLPERASHNVRGKVLPFDTHYRHCKRKKKNLVLANSLFRRSESQISLPTPPLSPRNERKKD